MLKRALWPWVLLSRGVRYRSAGMSTCWRLVPGRRVWSLRSHENISTVPLFQKQLEVSGEESVR